MRDRLKKLMDSENITAAQLSKIMNVNPATISHIISGRSSPKMDFIQKLLLAFPHINSNWIILGTGPKDTSEFKINNQKIGDISNKEHNLSLFNDDEIMNKSYIIEKEETGRANMSELEDNIAPLKEIDPNLDSKRIDIPIEVKNIQSISSKKIDRIIVFYNDKTYDEFIHNNK